MVAPATLMMAATAGSAPSADLGRLFLWVAVPSVVLAAVAAALIKRAVLARPRYRSHRPGWRVFVWVGLADMVAWAVLWPALVAVRVRGIGDLRALWVVALLLVVALGYVANRYGFARALHPGVAGSMRGTLLAELFTVLMPVLAVLIGLVILWLLSILGV